MGVRTGCFKLENNVGMGIWHWPILAHTVPPSDKSTCIQLEKRKTKEIWRPITGFCASRQNQRQSLIRRLPTIIISCRALYSSFIYRFFLELLFDLCTYLSFFCIVCIVYVCMSQKVIYIENDEGIYSNYLGNAISYSIVLAKIIRLCTVINFIVLISHSWQ